MKQAIFDLKLLKYSHITKCSAEMPLVAVKHIAHCKFIITVNVDTELSYIKCQN